MSIISLFLSIIAILFSGLTFYYKFLRPAKLKLTASEKIGLWHADGVFCLDVPMAISNEGTKTGYVHQIALTIKNLQNDDEKFFLKWNTFLKFNFQKNSWDPDEIASLISVPEKGSANKYIQFSSDRSMKSWIPSSGKYVVYVLGWSRKSETPNLFDKFELNIDDSKRDRLKQNLDANNKVTTYYIRSDWGKWIPKKLSSIEFRTLTKHIKSK